MYVTYLCNIKGSTNVLTPSDTRTRQYPHSYSYRLIQTTKTSYKYSFYPKPISHNGTSLPVAAVSCTTLDSFQEQIPNICFRPTFPHLKKHLYIVLA